MTSTIIKYVLVVLLLVVLIVYMTTGTGGSRKDTRLVYYYDEATNTVFLDSAQLIPPIKAPSQEGSDTPSGVRAYIFACESCAPSYEGMTLDEVVNNGGYIAWLEKYTPEGQQILSGNTDVNADADFETGTRYKLIRSPDNEQWVPVESRAANMIRAALKSRCGKATPRVCRPASE